jgi:hypothetical protein
MTELQALGQLLTASREDRTLRYKLLPYGEPGRTNKGRVTAGPGSVTIPAGALQVNRQHDKSRPVGLLLAEAVDDGLEAVVQLVNSQEANDALDAVERGELPGISVELANPVIRNGQLVASELVGAGMVEKPAFDSALLLASDDAAPAPDTEPATPDKKEEPLTNPAATLDATQADQLTQLLAAFSNGNNGAGAGAGAPAVDTSLSTVAAAMATAHNGQSTELHAAALDVITKVDVFDKVNIPQYVGELRSRRRYIPRYIPLYSGEDLTSTTITGWQYTTGKTPTVGDWSQAATGTIPNETMADIPTSEVATNVVTAQAAFLAGGNSIGRVHYDLPTPGFLESYIRESDDDFMRKLDQKVLTNMTTAANQTAVVSAGADATNVWTKIILGAHNVLEVDLPEWALIGPDLWRQAMATTKLEALELLSSALGLEEGTLDKFRLIGAPVSQTSLNGQVIVGSKSTATLHTLPGGPTRVEAINVQKGTVDNGVYGYWGIINHQPKALVKVS